MANSSRKKARKLQDAKKAKAAEKEKTAKKVKPAKEKPIKYTATAKQQTDVTFEFWAPASRVWMWAAPA